MRTVLGPVFLGGLISLAAVLPTADAIAQVAGGGCAPAAPAPPAPPAPPCAPGVPAPPSAPAAGASTSPSFPWVGKKTGRGQPYEVGKKRPRHAGGEPNPEMSSGAPAMPVPVRPTIEIALGDRVRGTVERDLENTILFPAVERTEVTLTLVTEEGTRPVTGRLIDPNGIAIADFLPERGDGTTAVIDSVALPMTGTYVVRVSFDRRFPVPYLLTTTGTYPERLDTELDLVGGRPICLSLGGMGGRRVKSAVVNRRGAADLELAAQLLAPEGEYIDIDDRAMRTWDGERWTIKNLPIETNADYLLYVVDRNRAKGRVKVSISFENAPLGRRLHDLHRRRGGY